MLGGDEAFTSLRAVNTGHPGSITTVHADSVASAVEQVILLTLQAGMPLRRDDVKHYVETPSKSSSSWCIGGLCQTNKAGDSGRG